MSSYFNEGEQKNSSDLNNETISNKSFCEKLSIYFNYIRDKIIIYRFQRWIVVLILTVVYLFRMFYAKGYYALTYCIGIHFLNSFMAFISPLDDPEDDLPEESSHLPQTNSEEFRPFQRKLKEYNFWRVMFWTLLVAIICTFFEAFDLPVFWPLLLFYFVLIFIRVYLVKDLIRLSCKRYIKDVLLVCVLVTLTSSLMPFLIYKMQEQSICRLIEVIVTASLGIVLSIYVLGLDRNERSFVKKQIKTKLFT